MPFRQEEEEEEKHWSRRQHGCMRATLTGMRMCGDVRIESTVVSTHLYFKKCR